MGYSDPVKGALSDWLAKKKSRQLQEEAERKTDAMRQHEYDVARRSILGEFSSQPISACYECVRNAKAARRRERLDLVNRVIVSNPELAAVAARLRQDMDEVENMRCAKHVYLANDPDAPEDLRDNPPPGFKKATPEQLEELGLDKSLLEPENHHFRAAVYIKDPVVWGANPKPGAILAFRGSTSAEEDWQNNFAQDANRESEYYRKAVEIGNGFAKNETRLHIVGHSLGGGLASAAQGGSGLTASTYNAAGLHPKTVARYSSDLHHMAAEPSKITAIRINGEVLTKTQEDVIGSKGLSLLANKAVGRQRDLIPSHEQSYFENMKKNGEANVDDDYGTYLHGMDEVIDSTEKVKIEDESALKARLKEEEPRE
jgi:hypothetical protein